MVQIFNFNARPIEVDSMIVTFSDGHFKSSSKTIHEKTAIVTKVGVGIDGKPLPF